MSPRNRLLVAATAFAVVGISASVANMLSSPKPNDPLAAVHGHPWYTSSDPAQITVDPIMGKMKQNVPKLSKKVTVCTYSTVDSKLPESCVTYPADH